MKRKSKVFVLAFALIIVLATVFAFVVNAADGDFTVSFYDAKDGKLKDTQTAVGGEITLPSVGYTSGDYTFFGWFTESGKVYEPGATITVTEDTNIYEAYGITTESIKYAELDLTWGFVRVTADIADDTGSTLSRNDGGGKNLVLDLNGHTITLSGGANWEKKPAFSYQRTGVVIVGNGTFTMQRGNPSVEVFMIGTHSYNDNSKKIWIGEGVTINNPGGPLVWPRYGWDEAPSIDLSANSGQPDIRIYGTLNCSQIFGSAGTLNGTCEIYPTATVNLSGANFIGANANDTGFAFNIDGGATINVTDSFTGFFSADVGTRTLTVEDGVIANVELAIPGDDAPSFIYDEASGKYITKSCDHANTTTTPGTPATCTEAGVTDEIVCDDCGKTLQAATEIEPLGHDFTVFVETASEADCTNAQLDTYKCSRCEETEDQSVGDPLGHDFTVFVETVSDADCLNAQVDKYKCSRCEETENQSVGDPVGHDWVDTGVTTEGNCIVPPTKEQQCSVCLITQNVETGSVTGHAWVEDEQTRVPATCTTDGTVERKCSVCLTEETYTYEESTGHNYVFGEEFYGDHTFNSVAYTDIKQVSIECSECHDKTTYVLGLIREDGGNRTVRNGDEVYVRFTFLFNGEEVTDYLPYFEVFTVEGYNKMLNGIVTEFTYKGEVINLREATVKVALPEGTTGLYLKGGEGFLANMSNLKEMGLPSTFAGLGDYGAMGKLGDFRFESNYLPRDFASISQGETFGSTNLLNEDLIFPVGFTSASSFYIGHNTNRVVFLGEMTKLEIGKFYKVNDTNGNKQVTVYIANANMSVSDIKGAFYPLTSIAADGTLTVDKTTVLVDQTGTGSFELTGEWDSKSRNANEVKIVFCAEETIVYAVNDSNGDVKFTYIKYDETTGKYLTAGDAEVTIDPSFDLSELAIHTHEKDGKCFCGEEVEVEEEVVPELSELVTFLGYAFSQDGKSLSATYQINRKLIAKYIELTGTTPDIGFIIVNAGTVTEGMVVLKLDGSLNTDIGKGKRQDISGNTQATRVTVTLGGLDKLTTQVSFVLAGYVSDGSDLVYIQGEELADSETELSITTFTDGEEATGTVKAFEIEPQVQPEEQPQE